jgi:hypothetical protein
MARGTWWCITRRPWGVAGIAYRGTPLYRMITTVRQDERVVVRVPGQQTPERLRAAFERSREGLLLGLFATSVRHLKARQTILSAARLDRVDKVLACYQEKTVPWLVELRAADRARFDRILERIWATYALHETGYALLDTVDPGWRTRLPS